MQLSGRVHWGLKVRRSNQLLNGDLGQGVTWALVPTATLAHCLDIVICRGSHGPCLTLNRLW